MPIPAFANVFVSHNFLYKDINKVLIFQIKYKLFFYRCFKMTDLQRIKKVVKWLIFMGFAENETDLAIKLGYTKSSVSQILNGKVPLSRRFIDNLCRVDANINKVWIITGEGEMLRSGGNGNDNIRIDHNIACDITSKHIGNIKKESSRNIHQEQDIVYLRKELEAKEQTIASLQKELLATKDEIIALLKNNNH